MMGAKVGVGWGTGYENTFFYKFRRGPDVNTQIIITTYKIPKIVLLGQKCMRATRHARTPLAQKTFDIAKDSLISEI